MYRERVKTIGFSILSQSGSFCLDIDWIKAMNTDSTEGNIIYFNLFKYSVFYLSSINPFFCQQFYTYQGDWNIRPSQKDQEKT